MRRAYLLWTVAAAGFAVDQITKAIAAVVVEGHEPRHALGGAVTFTAFRNSGAAGSFAPARPCSSRWWRSSRWWPSRGSPAPYAPRAGRSVSD